MKKEATSIKTLTANSHSSGYQGTDTFSATDAGLAFSVSILALFVISILVYLFSPKSPRQNLLSLKLNQKIPCDRCHFFGRNSYLQCAIHPSTAATENAVDCADYEPNNDLKHK
jgi:hypothetical protein